MATITTSTPTPSTPETTSSAKHFLKSKRFWGAVTALVGVIAKIVQQGSIGPDDMTALLGIAVAFYGGIVASGPLKASSGS